MGFPAKMEPDVRVIFFARLFFLFNYEIDYIRNKLAIFRLFGGNLDVEHHFYLLNEIEEIDGF